MARDYKLNLTISASIGSALKSVDKLEKKLKAVSKVGGTKGKVLGALGGAVGGLRKAAVGATSAFTTLGAVAGIAIGGIAGSVGLAAGALKTVLGGAVSLVKRGLVTLGAVAGATVAGIYATVKALAPAGFIQQASIQMEVMLKSADQARERLRWLRGIEVRTPFNIKEIIEGANQMQAFGVFSRRAFVAAGNASAAFGKRIGDIAGPLAKLKEGLFESESLALFGITRDKLREFGVKFGKQGELLTPGNQAFVGAIKVMEKAYGGMMSRISRTWLGVLSSLRSSVFNLFAKAGGGLLRYATPGAQAVKTFVDRIGARLETVDWQPVGKKILAAINFSTGVLGDLMDPEKRSTVTDSIKSIFAAFPGKLFAIFEAAWRDLGDVLQKPLDIYKATAQPKSTIGRNLEAAGTDAAMMVRAKMSSVGIDTTGIRIKRSDDIWKLLDMAQAKGGTGLRDQLHGIYKQEVGKRMGWGGSSLENLRREFSRTDNLQSGGSDYFHMRWQHAANQAASTVNGHASHDVSQMKAELRQQTQRLQAIERHQAQQARFFQNAQLPEIP